MLPHHSERIFHSGPLLHSGYTPTVDYEEFLEEHERQLKQAARRASGAHDGALNARKGWNHARSNGPPNAAAAAAAAVMEKAEVAAPAAESNGVGGVLPNSGPLVMPQLQKRSKSRLLMDGVDQRESRGEVVVDKDDLKYKSEALEKVQEA